MNAENDWQKFGLNFAVHFFNIKHETCTLKKLLVKCHAVMLNFDETRRLISANFSDLSCQLTILP